MRVTGLAIHSGVQAFLAQTYGLTKTDEVSGMPVFTEGGRTHVGGFKGFYAVVEGDAHPLVNGLSAWRAGKSYVRYGFSTEEDVFGTRRRHHLLAIPEGASADERYALYNGKTRNQVKKSEKLIADVRVEPRPKEFYDLYCRTVQRLGGQSRPESWFVALEASVGQGAQCACAYHEGNLIGASYFVVSGDYANMLFNISDEQYWHLDVNNRVYDAYIRAVIERGVRLVDFGPGMAGDKSHAHFKEGFGAVPHYLADRLYASPSRRVHEFFAETRGRARRLFRL